MDGVRGHAWSTIKASRAHWIKEKKITILVQMAMEKLPDVPGALELVNGESLRILEEKLKRLCKLVEEGVTDLEEPLTESPRLPAGFADLY